MLQERAVAYLNIDIAVEGMVFCIVHYQNFVGMNITDLLTDCVCGIEKYLDGALAFGPNGVSSVQRVNIRIFFSKIKQSVNKSFII